MALSRSASDMDLALALANQCGSALRCGRLHNTSFFSVKRTMHGFLQFMCFFNSAAADCKELKAAKSMWATFAAGPAAFFTGFTPAIARKKPVGQQKLHLDKSAEMLHVVVHDSAWAALVKTKLPYRKNRPPLMWKSRFRKIHSMMHAHLHTANTYACFHLLTSRSLLFLFCYWERSDVAEHKQDRDVDLW